MRQSWLLLVLCALPCLCQVQTSTKGACSPVVSGNNNRFTFYCDGLSGEQGKQLLDIMNRIAKDQLDPRAVMKALDEIKALAARNALAPETIAKGMQMYANGQELSPKAQAQSLYEHVSDYLDMRRRAWQSQKEQQESQGAQIQEQMQQALQSPARYDKAISSAYHLECWLEISKALKQLQARGIHADDLVEANEEVTSVADVQGLADGFKKRADPLAQSAHQFLVDFLDRHLRLWRKRDEQRDKAPLPDYVGGGVSADDFDKQTVDLYHSAYFRSVVTGLEQLRSKKIPIDALMESNKGASSVDDIRRLADGLKKLADSLPVQ